MEIKRQLTKFQTMVEYEEFIASDKFIKPNVSKIEDINILIYNSDKVHDGEESTSGSTSGNTSGGTENLKYFTIKNTGNDILTVSCKNNYKVNVSYNNQDFWENVNQFTILPNENVSLKGVDAGYSFKMSGNTTCDVEGNVMSLIYGDDFEGKTDLTGYIDAFVNLFENCTQLVNANNLILPATILSERCYQSMFYGCTSLVNAPELPATTLANGCYYMMFNDCTSLATAPELPATTLADVCYGFMFYGCTSLITAPELPATTLAYGCYNNMFSECSNLNMITMLATDISAEYCLAIWANGVASSGTFIKHPNMTSLPSGSSGIPNGWVVQDYML